MNDPIDTLIVFCDRADELLASRFVSQLADGVGTRIEWRSGCPLTREQTGPDEEAIRAFVCTLRLFLYDKDIGIRAVDRIIQQGDIDSTIKANCAAIRSALKAYLDSPCQPSFEIGGKLLTRRELKDTLLYGCYAHVDQDKTTTVSNWRKEPYWNDMKLQFDMILLNLVSTIGRVRDVCKQAICKLT